MGKDNARWDLHRGLELQRGVVLRHGTVLFRDETDATVTLVGKDLMSREEIVIKDVPWAGLEGWLKGGYIQDELRMVKAEDREFLISGYGAKSFKEIMGDPEDE